MKKVNQNDYLVALQVLRCFLFDLLLYVHSKELWSCRDCQLLNQLLHCFWASLLKAVYPSLPAFSAPSSASNRHLALLNQPKNLCEGQAREYLHAKRSCYRPSYHASYWEVMESSIYTIFKVRNGYPFVY